MPDIVLNWNEATPTPPTDTKSFNGGLSMSAGGARWRLDADVIAPQASHSATTDWLTWAALRAGQPPGTPTAGTEGGEGGTAQSPPQEVRTRSKGWNVGLLRNKKKRRGHTIRGTVQH